MVTVPRRWSQLTVTSEQPFAHGTRTANVRLDMLGLRSRSYSVLAIACSGLDATQREHAAVLELDPSQIVALVDGLEANGLVRREQRQETAGRVLSWPPRPAAPPALTAYLGAA